MPHPESLSLILCKGVPGNPLEEFNLRQYLDGCLDDIARRGAPTDLILATGQDEPNGRREEITALHAKLEQMLPGHAITPLILQISEHRDPCNARESIHYLALVAEQKQDLAGVIPRVLIYGEQPQEDWLRFLAGRMFPKGNAIVVPVIKNLWEGYPPFARLRFVPTLTRNLFHWCFPLNQRRGIQHPHKHH